MASSQEFAHLFGNRRPAERGARDYRRGTPPTTPVAVHPRIFWFIFSTTAFVSSAARCTDPEAMLISIHRSPSTAGLRWLDNFGHRWKNELLQRAHRAVRRRCCRSRESPREGICDRVPVWVVARPAYRADILGTYLINQRSNGSRDPYPKPYPSTSNSTPCASGKLVP